MGALKESQGKLILVVAGIILVIGASMMPSEQNMSPFFIGIVSVALFLFAFVSVPLSLQLLIVSMLLSPEFIIGQTAKREVTIRFDDVILFVITFAWLLRIAIMKDVGFAIHTPLNKPIVAYSLIAIFATALGVWRANVVPLQGFFFVLKFIEYFLLFIMVVNYVRDIETINRMLTTLLTVSGIVCAYGLFMAFTGGDVSAPFEGSTGERNTLGGYLIFMSAIAGGLFLYSKSQRERNISFIMIVAMTAVLLFSVSRSSWVSFIFVVFILFIYAPDKNIYLAGAILLITILPFIIPEVARERVNYTFFQRIHPGMQFNLFGITLDTSSSARIFSYFRVLKEIIAYPFFGYGVTGFAFVDGQFFRTLSEMGIVGLSILCWLFYRIIRMSREVLKLEHLPPRLRGMTVGFLAGFCGLLIHAFTANTFIIVRIAEPFWCVAGLVVVTEKIFTGSIDKGDSINQEELEEIKDKVKIPRIIPSL